MKKTFLYLFTLILAILMLSGCEMAASESEAKNSSDPVPTVISEASAASEPASQASESSREIDTSVSERDASGTYDGSEAYVLSPGEDLTIREGGIYILSGIYTNQMIVVDAGEEGDLVAHLEDGRQEPAAVDAHIVGRLGGQRDEEGRCCAVGAQQGDVEIVLLEVGEIVVNHVALL